ncbi:MAG: hypothetical protein KC445_01370 [Anaerolineales bacterium]|nr:hypothetical protein [Anaerolineales bacterium]
MTSNQPRSFGRRLWWIIRTVLLIFIVLVLAAAALGGLGYAGYLGVQEIQRSNNSLMMRIEANEQNLDSLREMVNSEFAAGDPEQQVQINQMQVQLDALTRQLEAAQTDQAEVTAVQADQIDTLEANLATAVARNGNLSDELETVQIALVALQSDFNSMSGRVDSLGGGLDSLRLNLSVLDDSLTDLNTEMTAAKDSEANDLQQSLLQLQLWGTLTTARFALLDGDVTVAETAVTQAISQAANLTAAPDSLAAAALNRLKTRLSLAADGFATDLDLVAQDLQAAGNELNLLIVGPAPEAELVEATTAPTNTATPEETMTPEPTTTPSSTATPTTSP